MSCSSNILKHYAGDSFSIQMQLKEIHESSPIQLPARVGGIILPENLIVSGDVFTEGGKHLGNLTGTVLPNQSVNSGWFELQLQESSEDWPQGNCYFTVVLEYNGKKVTIAKVEFTVEYGSNA